MKPGCGALTCGYLLAETLHRPAGDGSGASVRFDREVDVRAPAGSPIIFFWGGEYAFLLHLHLDEEPEAAVGREAQIDGFELPAPFAARIESEFDGMGGTGHERLGTERKGSASATPLVTDDDKRAGRTVFEPQTRNGDFAGTQTPQPHGIAAAGSKQRIGQNDDAPLGPDRSGRRTAGTAKNGRHEKKRNAEHRARQIKPRPDFLIRPSAVSDSTILSSTPLMKVLLPGVE